MSEIRNAIITGVDINDADRGFLSAWVLLDYGGSGQGFGGHVLYLPKDFDNHGGPNYAGHFIWRVMEVAGVTKWTHVAGKCCRVRIENGLAVAIGHIVNDDWFCPAEDFTAMEAKEPA